MEKSSRGAQMGSPHQTRKKVSDGVDVGSTPNMGSGCQGGCNMQGYGGPSSNP
jgi:hypothetical protein